MSQPAVSALAPLPFELVYSDGEPLESEWHVVQMTFLMGVIRQLMAERGRSDFFVGGDMFVYHSVEQARDVARGKPYLRGPDVFWVGGGVESRGFRNAWVSWEEGGRLPDVIVELLSPSTAKIDRTVKKDLYARIFRTPEYFLCEPLAQGLEGFELTGFAYRPIEPDSQGRLWSQQLDAFLGIWHGVVDGKEGDWVRLFHKDGSLVPTQAEAAEERAQAELQRAETERQRAETERQRAETERQRAETERQRAETERRRAEAAENELARLRAQLEERN